MAQDRGHQGRHTDGQEDEDVGHPLLPIMIEIQISEDSSSLVAYRSRFSLSRARYSTRVTKSVLNCLAVNDCTRLFKTTYDTRQLERDLTSIRQSFQHSIWLNSICVIIVGTD